MRIILVGAPGSGKRELAEAVAEALDIEVADDPVTVMGPDDPAVGMLTDYRIEMQMALLRALRPSSKDEIFTHSLIDSTAYSTLKLDDMIDADADMPDTFRWILAAGAITSVAEDSFQADFIFLLPGYDDDGLDFNKRLYETLVEVLELAVPEYVLIQGDLERRVEIIRNVVQSEAGETE